MVLVGKGAGIGIEVEAVGGGVGGEEGDSEGGIGAIALAIAPAIGPTVIVTLFDVVKFFVGGIEAEVVTAVIGGEEVAALGVEGEVVGVAEAGGDDLAVAGKGVEAHDGGTAEVVFETGVAGGADADVKLVIGTELEVIVLVEAEGEIGDKGFDVVGDEVIV